MIHESLYDQLAQSELTAVVPVLLAFAAWCWCLMRSQRIERGGFRTRQDQHKREHEARMRQLKLLKQKGKP